MTTDPLTGAATIVGLSVAAKPALDLVKDFLGRVLAPTGDAVGQAMAHPIVEWQKRRVDRAAKLVEDAATAVAKSGQAPQPVPPRLLIPILERGSLEDDTYLRERWVALLANAATNPTGLIPALATILAELSPQEARVLDRMYQLLFGDVIQRRSDGVEPEWLLSDLGTQLTTYRLREHVGVESPTEFDVMMSNLQRLSLVQASGDHQELGPQWRLKTLGRALVAACTNQ